MLDENAIVPELVLVELEVTHDRAITFEIIDGEATFADGSQMVSATTRDGKVTMPSLVAGPITDESYLRVMMNGERLFEDLRFVTLLPGMLQGLKRMISDLGDLGEGATLLIAEHYVIVDMSRLDLSKLDEYERNNPIDYPAQPSAFTREPPRERCEAVAGPSDVSQTPPVER